MLNVFAEGHYTKFLRKGIARREAWAMTQVAWTITVSGCQSIVRNGHSQCSPVPGVHPRKKKYLKLSQK
jgi:hypothetical protein